MNILKPHVSLKKGKAWEVFVVKREATGVEKQTSTTGCCVPAVRGDGSCSRG